MPFNHDVFDRAVREVFNRGGFSPEMLADPAVRALIEETYNALNGAVSSAIRTDTPPELTAALQNNTFIFSGFKTYHSLSEVGLALTDADGRVKSFSDFRRDVETVDKKYNGSYLYAEYNHAIHTSQMAVKWNRFVADGNEYWLQYRTVGDDRVREEHAALDNVTLPPSDPFWNEYLPPNGWNCRCDVDQVLRSDYPMSDPEDAKAKGDACTDTPKSRIFRYNAGKEMTVFPKKHPYLPKGCGNCPEKGKLSLARGLGLPQCQVCGQIAKECLRNVDARLKEWREKNIPERGGKRIEGDNFKFGSMLLTRGALKHVQEHTANMAVLNALFGIERKALEFKYIGWMRVKPDKDSGKKHGESAFFLYYEVEIAGKTYYVNVQAHRHLKAEVPYCVYGKIDKSALLSEEPPGIDEW